MRYSGKSKRIATERSRLRKRCTGLSAEAKRGFEQESSQCIGSPLYLLVRVDVPVSASAALNTLRKGSTLIFKRLGKDFTNLIGRTVCEAYIARSFNGFLIQRIIHTCRLLLGPSTVVPVSGIAQKCNLSFFRKPVYIELALIALTGSGTGRSLSEPSFFTILLYRQVDHGFLISIINSGNAGLIALLVINLDLFNDISRKILQSRLRTFSEKILSVNKNL